MRPVAPLAVLALHLAAVEARAGEIADLGYKSSFKTLARRDAPELSDLPETGIRAGEYLIIPAATAEATFDDNVKAKDGTRGSDWRAELGAGLRFESHLPRHMLNVMLDGRFVDYAEHGDQSYLDGAAAAEWRLDIDHGNAIGGEFETALRHEEWLTAETPDDISAPVEVWQSHMMAGLVHDIGRIGTTIGVEAERADYRDAETYAGETVDQDYRDFESGAVFGQLDYRFSPGYRVYLGLRGERVDYTDEGADDRDARLYEARLGSEIEIDPVVRLRLTGGYAFRDYEEDVRSDFGSYLWRAEVEWEPSEATRIRAAAGQELGESSLEQADARFDTSARLSVEHELTRDLTAVLEADYVHRDFLGIERTDELLRGRGALRYNLDANVMFTFAYEHRERDSTDDRFDTDENLYTAGVGVRY